MNQSIDIFNSLHEATDGCVEELKSKVCAYQWSIQLGRKIIHNREYKIRMQEIVLKQVNCN